MIKRLNEETIQQIACAYKAGYAKCREDMGDLRPYFTKRQAYKQYGQEDVDRWINEGLIDVIKDGDRNTKCRIRREQIELVVAESNRTSFYGNHRSEGI